MILNGKKFIPPMENDERDLKEIFLYMVKEGAGRAANDSGFPIGYWTPDEMAEAICQLEDNKVGIDLRSVQRWFQDNERGIKVENLRWIAMVFGCGDVDASIAWQVALVSASKRLKTKRRAKPKNSTNSPKEAHTNVSPSETRSAHEALAPLPVHDIYTQPQDRSLAHLYRSIFANQHPLTLPSVVWAFLTALSFLTFIFGIQSVTYRAAEGLDKQVGFLWAPSWTLLPLIILPAFLILVTKVLRFWETTGRAETINSNALNTSYPVGWRSKLTSFTWLFWVISVVSVGFIFLLQWSGVHLRALLNNDAKGYMMDWTIIAIARPDIISTSSSIFVSFIAYIFFGFLMLLLFAGLVVLLAITSDFFEICRASCTSLNHDADAKIRDTGGTLLLDAYRCSVLAIMFVTCIKLQSTYLISRGPTLSSWLIGDASTILFGEPSKLGYLDQRGIPQFTSILLIILVAVIFVTCLLQICVATNRSPLSEVIFHLHLSQWRMLGVVSLLSGNVVVIGMIDGFSLLLTSSIIIALVSLQDSKFMVR